MRLLLRRRNTTTTTTITPCSIGRTTYIATNFCAGKCDRMNKWEPDAEVHMKSPGTIASFSR
ncbi:hypothetical protein WUBG_07884, partial [Wuchereria bancrofti]